jgi:hypothetical protein
MPERDKRRTVIKCMDGAGIWHEVVWLVGVANVIRCSGALPSHLPTGSIRGNPTTCLLCIGAC